MMDGKTYNPQHNPDGPHCECETCQRLRGVIQKIGPHLQGLDTDDMLLVLSWFYASLLSMAEPVHQFRIQLMFMEYTSRSRSLQAEYIEEQAKRN